jgi:O-antigen/teichoic acid export membrane protein
LLVAASALVRFLPDSIPTGVSVALLTVLFGVSQLGSWLAAVLAARGSFAPINISAVVVSAIGAGVSVGLLVLSPPWVDAGVIIGLTVLLEIVRTVILGYSARRLVQRDPALPEDVMAEPMQSVRPHQVWRYAGLAFVGDALLFMTYRFDMWVIDANQGAGELGRYALAVSLAQLVWIVPAATGRVLFPYSAMPEVTNAPLLAWRSAQIAFLVSAGSAIAGWLASILLVPLLFGQEFAGVSWLIGILLFGIVPFSISKVLGNYLAGTNALGTNVAISAAVLVLTVGLDLILIPSMAASGAALASVVSYVTFTLLLFVVFLRRTSMSLRSAFTWRQPVSERRPTIAPH